MDETLALIDRIIQEHQIAFERFRKVESVLNDVQAISGMEVAKETFMPGRFDQREGLKKLRESLATIEEGLLAHFKREETALLTVFEEYGEQQMVAALNVLLSQHGDLRSRLDRSKQHITELIEGNLSQHKWQASAHDMRAHLSHTRKLLEAHAGGELPLLLTLRWRLEERIKQKLTEVRGEKGISR